jgi:methylenetetrahydrofolate dehydrogenase (NAD+)
MNVHDPTRPAGEQLRDQEICIINRSDVVGLPLAQLLAGEGARVYSVDNTGVQLFHRAYYPWSTEGLHRKDLSNWTLRDAVQRSRVVISAVPDPAFKVDTKWLQRGAICVNVASGMVRLFLL